jgi:hypothetical protein
MTLISIRLVQSLARPRRSRHLAIWPPISISRDAMTLRIRHNEEKIAKVTVCWRIFLTEMIRGYESSAIRNKGCAEASDMAACTRSMGGGMAKDTVHGG